MENDIFGIEDEAIETIEEPNENNDDDFNATDESKRIVKPKKVVTRPQPKLDVPRLTGPRGIGTLEEIFKTTNLKGKGHEKENLDTLMKTLEHWAHRLFPKMAFDDCLDRIEDLGSKKSVNVHLTKIRLDMEDKEAQIIPEESALAVHDPFDDLLPEQPKQPSLTEEQRARMMRNRLLAEERRMERMKAAMEKNKVFELN